MTVYKDVPYVEVEMKNKKMSFKVPEDVAKELLKLLKNARKNPERFYYFKFSGFKASNSGTTKRPLRISTSSK